MSDYREVQHGFEILTVFCRRRQESAFLAALDGMFSGHGAKNLEFV